MEPQILRTCLQIRDEASYILYNSNAFLVYFCSGDSDFASPILPDNFRAPHQSRWSMTSIFRDMVDLHSMRNIKHWIFIISPPGKRSKPLEAGGKALVRFCRMLSDRPPKSLDVQLVPKAEFLDFDAKSEAEYIKVKHLLDPFSLLRSIPQFDLGELRQPGRQVSLRALPRRKCVSIKIDQKYSQDLQVLVQGNSQAMRVFKMHERLLAYAQSFERHEPFKKAMEADWGEARHLRDMRQNFKELLPWDGLKCSTEYTKKSFNSHYLHPVESNIEIADIASEDNDPIAFRAARKLVVEFLEPQYWRVKAASQEMNEFVKRRISRYSWLGDIGDADFFLCLALLEDYRQSFVRDIPTHQKRRMRGSQKASDVIYAMGMREIGTQKLQNWSEMRGHNAIIRELHWNSSAKEAMDDMNEQYLQIRAARKSLFAADPDSEHGCGDIDVKD